MTLRRKRNDDDATRKGQRMKSFAIYGASDDLVEQEADGKSYDETSQPRSFSFLWDTINGARAPWSSDPWVWRVEFKTHLSRRWSA